MIKLVAVKKEKERIAARMKKAELLFKKKVALWKKQRGKES